MIVLEVVCWWLIGGLGLLSANDMPVSDDLRVATVVYVLPANLALPPLLYVVSVVSERRRLEREDVLKKAILARLKAKGLPKNQ